MATAFSSFAVPDGLGDLAAWFENRRHGLVHEEAVLELYPGGRAHLPSIDELLAGARSHVEVVFAEPTTDRSYFLVTFPYVSAAPEKLNEVSAPPGSVTVDWAPGRAMVVAVPGDVPVAAVLSFVAETVELLGIASDRAWDARFRLGLVNSPDFDPWRPNRRTRHHDADAVRIRLDATTGVVSEVDGTPIEAGELPVTNETRNILQRWQDIDRDLASQRKVAAAENEGLRLWLRLHQELGPAYEVFYVSLWDGRLVSPPEFA